MLKTKRSLPLAVAATSAVLLIAACGSSSNNPSNSNSASNSNGTPTQAQLHQDQQDAVRFVSCMGAHGVHVPSPTVSPHGFKNVLVNPTPGFQAALAICRHWLPGGGPRSQGDAYSPRRAAALLAFAHCMRAHAVQNFPDPNGQAQITREMIAAAGLDLHNTTLIEAADTCTSVTHGLLTKADVARFAAGQ
jgi:hypothetical protein